MALLVSAFTLFACHKSRQMATTYPLASSQWRWTNLTVPIGSGVGNWQPASDSVVILSLDGDSGFKIRINDSLASAGHYRVTPDSQQMVFSISAPIYPNGLLLCGNCGLTFSGDRDTIGLRLPLSNPLNIGLYTFIRVRQ
jgi:hypothetical protein